MKLIVASCLCLGAASGLAAQSISFTIQGSLGTTPISGTDPLLLAGSPYTVTTSVNAVGKPFATGSETYTGLTVSITATSGIFGTPKTFMCSGATSTVTAGSGGDSISLTNCNITVAGIDASFSAITNFPANTFVSPIPLAFTAPSMLPTSTATYTLSGAATTFAITGSTTAACSGCSTLSLTPSSVTLAGQTGGSAVSQSVSVGSITSLLPYALVTSGASWLGGRAAGGING